MKTVQTAVKTFSAVDRQKINIEIIFLNEEQALLEEISKVSADDSIVFIIYKNKNLDDFYEMKH